MPGLASKTLTLPASKVACDNDTLAGKKILIIVENLPLPLDRRVWQEARTLRDHGAIVSIICPTGKGFLKRYELLEGIHIYRHTLPVEADSAFGYLREYSSALIKETFLAWKIFFQRGIDVIHACNPPDLIFLVAIQFKLFGVRFLFDHHDVNPELYEAKFGKRNFFWRILLFFERLTFLFADVSIATNSSFRNIALTRGRMLPSDVFVVRSGPDLDRIKLPSPDPKWKNGRKYLIGYVGVMGDQEGIDLLLASASHLVHTLGRSDIQFALVGGGSSFESLNRLSSDLGLTDFVTFVGWANDQLLFSVLAASDVCVAPDRVNAMNNISTMNKILEYMAVSKPIVQFDLVEGRFSAGAAAFYAKSNDPIDFAHKLVEFLEDADLRNRAGKFGRERLENELAWLHQAPILIKAYERVLGKPSSRSTVTDRTQEGESKPSPSAGRKVA